MIASERCSTLCLIVPVIAIVLSQGGFLLNLKSAGMSPRILVSALFNSRLLAE